MRMLVLALCIAAATGLIPLSASAREQVVTQDKQPSSQFTAKNVLIGEGLLLGNAWIASYDPHAYGALGMLLFLAAVPSNDTVGYVSLAAAESVAIYNIVALDKDEDSQGKIFSANVVAWHLFAATVVVTGLLTDDREQIKKSRVAFVPVAGGGMLSVSYAF